MSAASLNTLRRELVYRFETHPPSTWSTDLLAAFIDITDVAYPQLVPDRHGQPFKLHLVK